jgi:hypothetical protein
MKSKLHIRAELPVQRWGEGACGHRSAAFETKRSEGAEHKGFPSFSVSLTLLLMAHNYTDPLMQRAHSRYGRRALLTCTHTIIGIQGLAKTRKVARCAVTGRCTRPEKHRTGGSVIISVREC